MKKTKCGFTVSIIFLVVYVSLILSCNNEAKHIEKIQNLLIDENLPKLDKYIDKYGYFAVSNQNKNQIKPIHLAAILNDVDSIKLFIDKGASIKEVDKDNRTPLLTAFNSNSKDVVNFLLTTYPETIQDADLNGNNILIYALEDEEKYYFLNEIVKLSKMLDFDFINKKKQTYLMIACKQEDLPSEYIDLLLKKSSNVDSIDKSGLNALMYYAKKGKDAEILEKLILKTNDINRADNILKTALMYSSQNNLDVQFTQMLIDLGADINIVNERGWNPLMYSARYNPNYSVSKELLLRGSDFTGNSAGLSPFILSLFNNLAVSREIMQFDNNISKKTINGKTPLMIALEQNAPETSVIFLINEGANLKAMDNTNKTILMYAAEFSKNSNIIEKILTSGASTTLIDNSGMNAIDYLSLNDTLREEDIYWALSSGKEND